MQSKMQKKCNFWKFVFVKHAHFQNLHFFRIFFGICFAFCLAFFFAFFAFYLGFFAIFEKFEALTKPPPKNAKNANCICFIFLVFFRIFSNVFFGHVFAFFFGFFCILPSFFFAIFEKFEALTKPPPTVFFLHFCLLFFF